MQASYWKIHHKGLLGEKLNFFTMVKAVSKHIVLAIAILLALTACDAGETTHRIKRHLKQLASKLQGTFSGDKQTFDVDIAMIDSVTVHQDVPYGEHANQTMDIYAPDDAKDQPILMHLHGGGWSGGSKSERVTYINKVNRWVAHGFIVISVETRLMPDAKVYGQVHDLAKAVVMVQQQAKQWGGNGSKLILSGHSSAGTMVSVLAAKPQIVIALGGQRWLGSIAIDSSSLDIPRTMQLWSPEMFRYAYGDDTTLWKAASPINLLSNQSLPLLLACSKQRLDSSCEQAELFIEQANQYGLETTMIKRDFDHGAMDFELGLNADYTQQVERFMASLDETVAHYLKQAVVEAAVSE